MPRMELARELEASLREFSAAATVEVRENGGRVAPLASLSWEVRGAAKNPFFIYGPPNTTLRAEFWPSPTILSST